MLNTLPQPAQNVIMEGALFDKEKFNNSNNNKHVFSAPTLIAIIIIKTDKHVFSMPIAVIIINAITTQFSCQCHVIANDSTNTGG